MSRKVAIRLIVVAALVAAAVALQQSYGRLLTLQNLADREQAIRQFQTSHPWLTYGAALAVYVLVTGMSLPGATGLTLVYGWFFGLVRGLLVVSFASTAGATLAFLMSRYLLRDVVRSRFGKQLAAVDQELEREGPFFLFTMRLIPVFPFFVINVVMGLTPMSAITFWWVSQLGMLPGTAVYVFAGASVPDIQTLAERGAGGILTPQLIVGLVLLGLFPLATRWLLRQRRPPSDKPSAPDA